MPAERIQAAVAAGDWDTAETLLRDILRQDAGTTGAVALLGHVLQERGKLDEAESLMAPAAESAPTPELLNRLARVQYQRQAFDACERTLERLITLAPKEAGLLSYRLLLKLKLTAGRTDEARAVMSRAVREHEGRTEFVVAYTDLLPPDEAITELERHLKRVGADPARAAYLLERITIHRAPELRRRRGLPDFGLTWQDTYQWPDADMLPTLKRALVAEVSGGSTRATARLALTQIAVAEGAWDLAETYLAELRGGPKRTFADFTAFGARFHTRLDAMSDRDIYGDLAPVRRIAAPDFQSRETVVMAGDPKYFARFILPFLRQLDAAQIPIDLHVHLLDGADPDWAEARDAVSGFAFIRVALTAEASGAAAQGTAYARRYYHAVRYIRVFEELQRTQRRMWILDCDVELLRDPRPLFASLRPYDIALRTTPCAFAPMLKITASCVGISPTQRGLEFTRRVAAYIAHWKKRETWGWGVDQTALFSAYAHMSEQGREPLTLYLDDLAMNDRTGRTGAIRFLPGVTKYLETDQRLTDTAAVD